MPSRRGLEPTSGRVLTSERRGHRARFGAAVLLWTWVVWTGVAAVIAACLAPSADAQSAAHHVTHVNGPGGATAAAAAVRARPRVASAPQARVAMPLSTSYVLVDVNTGNVLAGYNEHVRVRPASLTKILTALIAVGYLPTAARVPGTVQSWNAYPNNVGIEKGVAWPLNEVLQALLVYSANDAAYAIAQRVSGTLAAFGPVMDGAARQIGMSDNPVFHDPAGLDGPEGVGGGNWVSARDLAIAGRDLLYVPQLARIVRQQSAAFVDPTGAAHDLPSMNYAFLASYPGAIGVKTGFTDRAGSCIMAAATRDGRTMLAVVMNGYNPTQSAIDLLNQGFATPVAAEPAIDRLPALALPRPPVLRPVLRARVPAHSRPVGRSSRAATAGLRLSSVRPLGAGLAARADQVPAGTVTTRAGLAAVVQSWPAQTLLMLAGLAALLALWELVCTNRIYRHRGQAANYDNRKSRMGGVSSSRKRRQELVASYRRHERHDGVGGASSLGRR